MPEFSVLKKRRSFVRLTKGAFCVATRTLVLQAMESEAENVSGKPRIGYTTTKKIGKAHTRNRCRRRLRAAAALLFAEYAMANFDYVLVARYTTEMADFATICEDLVYALKKAKANFVNDEERGK
ncbi:MAG: ribonuclease P protein component [Alphaproteobacteria bacterium]|nr:ribonuclease P protein component [Alphaproteobacteria bacterium]